MKNSITVVREVFDRSSFVKEKKKKELLLNIYKRPQIMVLFNIRVNFVSLFTDFS